MLTRRHFVAGSFAAGLTAGAGRSGAQTESRDVPWLSACQRMPDGFQYTEQSPRRQILDARRQPVTTRAQWEQRRGELSEWWLDYLGPLPGKRAYVPDWEVVQAERLEGGIVRERIRYEVEPGFVTEAYVVRPRDGDAAVRRAGAAVFHSTVAHSIRQPAGVEGRPEKAFALKLARQGVVTISPRNYLWPDNHHIDAGAEAARFSKRMPRSKGMAKMLYDAMVAVNILTRLPQVDADRLGCVGHSLGAKEVLYLAALDPRIQATVSSEGGVGTRFSNWDAPWYLGPEIREAARQHEHHELLALAAPRPFLLIGGDSADGDRSWPFIEAALPIYRLYGRPARLALYNHKQGHAVPPAAEQRIMEWMLSYRA